MNKGYFEGLMKLPPETLQQKYVFLVSSLDLSLNIISAGFSAVYLTRKDEKGWYTLEKFSTCAVTPQNRVHPMLSPDLRDLF